MDNNFINILNNHITETLKEISLEDNLRDLGLDSMASIDLILDLEDYYNVSFPDEFLTEELFKSTINLWEVLNSLLQEGVK